MPQESNVVQLDRKSIPVPSGETQEQSSQESLYAALKGRGSIHVEKFMRKVMELSDQQHMTYGVMASSGSLAEFFGGLAINERSLKDTIGYIVVKGEAPQWFSEWRSHHRGFRRAPNPAGKSAASDLDETVALANVYAEENEQLKRRVKELESDLAVAKHVRAQAPRPIEQDLRDVLAALETLVAQGLTDAPTALKMIRTKLGLS